MAVGIVDRQKLVNIADAVREKKGITGNMTLDAIASNITSMPTADNNAKYDFSWSGSSGDLMQHLTKIDLSGWDTSNITDMGNMFDGCSLLTSLDVSKFNTDNVTNMGQMFNGCSSLTSLDVSSFNTSKVNSYSSFQSMFTGCSYLKSLDLSNFDFSNAHAGDYTGMYALLRECKSLKTIKLPSTVTFNNSGVSFMFMFNGCSSLTSLDLSGWDTSNVTNMNSTFSDCLNLYNLTLGTDWASNSKISSFDLSYCPLTRESAIDVINKLATRSNSPVIKFSNQVGLYQSEIDVATNKGWSVSGCSVLVEDATTVTVGQCAIIDGVPSKCVYVADTLQDWGQRIFGSLSKFIDSNGDSTFQWGGYKTTTGITATDIGTGLANTNALLAMNLQSTDGTPTVWDALAEFRSTYGDRWFIPSMNEGRGYDEKTETWTSSEVDTSKAYSNIGNNIMTKNFKSASYPFAPFTYV